MTPRDAAGRTDDAAWLRDWQRAITRRLVTAQAVRTTTLALASATVPAAGLVWGGVAWPVVLGVVLAGTMVGTAVRARRTPQSVARELEERVPASRNLLVTALQLSEASGATASPMTPTVLQRARALVAEVDVRALVPVRWGPAIGALGLLLAGQALVHRLPRSAAPGGVRSERADIASADAFVVQIVSAAVRPPAYLGTTDSLVADPSRLRVPEGAMVRLRLRAVDADSVVLDTRAPRQLAVRDRGEPDADAPGMDVHGLDARGATARDVSAGDGFTVEWRADADEVLALTAYRGARVAHALVGITVQRDADPRVRITAPGRDLVLPRGDTTLRVVVRAEDEHALGLLQLRYTRVSGSGERYEFTEGEVPLAIRRATAARWEAEVAWDLRTLGLEPGDVLVYKAVAADRRPGAPLVESDAWIAEVPTGRGDGAEGFAVDVGETRYALSQQMVVLRIERLLAARDSLGAALSDESFAGLARNIAVEQRRVRAEFVFLMGGELTEEVTADNSMGDLDEHQHAEVEADLSAGRVRNEGRDAVFAAIRAMSRAATALTDTAVRPALQQARLAVEQLEIAFSRARFLMRPLATREAIDRTRRLTGSLVGVTSTAWPASAPPSRSARQARVEALRALTTAVPDVAATWQQLATRLVRSGSSDARAQAVALALNDAALAHRRGDLTAAHAARDEAVTLLQQWVLEDTPPASGAVRTPRSAALDAQAALSTTGGSGARLGQP